MSPIEWVASVVVGVIVGLLVYDALKALYRWLKGLSIDWDLLWVTVVAILVLVLAAVGAIAVSTVLLAGPWW